MQITPQKDKREADTKRFPLMHTVKDKCPNCGEEVTLPCDENLEYPVINAANKLYFYCDECDNDWTRKVVVRIVIEEA